MMRLPHHFLAQEKEKMDKPCYFVKFNFNDAPEGLLIEMRIPGFPSEAGAKTAFERACKIEHPTNVDNIQLIQKTHPDDEEGKIIDTFNSKN